VTQMERIEVYLSLGSNLGDRYLFLERGITLITTLEDVTVCRLSDIYETEAVDYVDQPKFLNIAASVMTSIRPQKFLQMLKEIEIKVGRINRGKWREREIDIDLIFYGDFVINSEAITIPHPRMHLRRFVLEPLNEIAPKFLHPTMRKTVHQLLLDCPDGSEVSRVGRMKAFLGNSSSLLET
jgi:2-amino-4-hydroxy-6-hydroxymethyldihydropteridine diphosphokinase